MGEEIGSLHLSDEAVEFCKITNFIREKYMKYTDYDLETCILDWHDGFKQYFSLCFTCS